MRGVKIVNIRYLVGVCFVGLVIVAVTTATGPAFLASAAGQTSAPQSPVKVAPPASVSAMANNPAPPASAKQASTIGSGDTKLQTSDKAQDMDSYWVESIDIDGDGNVEEADVLWDDEDKVLFLYDEGPFMCQSGGQGTGDLLMAIYGHNNTSKRPAGSGWFITDLDAGECGVQAEGLFACRFDAKGKATECGTAVLDDKTDELIITKTRISGNR
jgi:hypothetical protein